MAVPLPGPPLEDRDLQAKLETLAAAVGQLTQFFFSGTGSPEGAVTASRPAIYLRYDGGAATTLYVKESGTGNTGWVAK